MVRAYLKRVFAGAVFGMYMAHLLYFLNPQIDITPVRLMAVTLTYGAICGLACGTILWGLHLVRLRIAGRPQANEPDSRRGFGFVVLAVFLSAVIYWIHLTAVRIYLPIGAVRILNKATIVIAVTAFVLLILWFLERGVGQSAARLIVGTGIVLIAVSSFFLYQRRESYRTEKRNVVVANIGTVASRRPLIVIAIRNLPYDWILTLSGEGVLPFLTEATQHAYFKRIEPFPATTADPLWASLATGKLPYRHGVTGEYSYRTPLNGRDPAEKFLLLPSGVGFQGWGLIPPVKRISAHLPSGEALPFWTAFGRLALSSQLINWPSSPPGGATRVITDAALRADLRGTQRAVAAVAQRFNGTGAARARILDGLAADTAAIDLLQSEGPFDLRVVALEGFSEAQRGLHIFSNELPPRNSARGGALRAYAQQLDAMLASVARQNPGQLLMVCSPSAVAAPALPASAWSLLTQALSNDDPGSYDGFLLITGPGVAHGSAGAEPAVVVDVVPTLLFAAGLPVGRDMDGRILTEAFDDEFLRRTKLSAIQTYDAEQLIVRRGGA